MNWWAARLLEDNPVALVSWVVVVVGSIVLHELAHGWVATWLGDDTPRAAGHLTINPLVHIPPMSWLMFALFGFAWGLMPVNPTKLRGRYAESLVAVAGPAMNILLAILGVVAIAVWLGIGQGQWSPNSSIDEPLFSNTARFLWYAVMLNVILAMLNLLPVPPLDGWRIASNLIPRFGRLWESERGAQAAIIAFIVFFFIFSRYVVTAGAIAAGAIVAIVTGLIAPGVDLSVLNF